MTDKQKVLADATGTLNKQDQPWEVTVEGDSIVARWRWKDATLFGFGEISNEVRDYKFIVTLTDKGKWKEKDKTSNQSSGIKINKGKGRKGKSMNSFSGNTSQKSISFGVGKNNATGETGVVRFDFDTSKVKKPVREYLTACGWKKAGFFG